MNFEQILPTFREGKKARRKSWIKDNWVENKCDVIYDNYGKSIAIWGDDLLADDWEFVSEPEIDWQKVIDNKCPCWFWREDEDKKVLGEFAGFNKDAPQYPHWDTNNILWEHCRPIRKDEVTFYEDVE